MNPVDEISLDPENWEDVRKLGHEIIDDMVDYLKNIKDEPVWRPIPEDVKQTYQLPLPLLGEHIQDIYTQIKNNIIPYKMGNTSSRYWAMVSGTGTITAAFADFISSILNPNSVGGEHSAIYIERQVIDWVKELMGFDVEASGIITSGGSMANLIGLIVSRNVKIEDNIREKGLQSSSQKYTYYGSTEMHSSIQKAIEIIGIGNQYLRKIIVNKDYQIDVNKLKEKIIEDKENGYTPICIIGTLGTVNTGAVDDLISLGKIAKDNDMWFHVDGAFGALTKISTEYSELADGMDLSDSLCFDFHKWFYINYEAGCILIRNKDHHNQSFILTPEYLSQENRGAFGGDLWFSDYGIELSRAFKALKIWVSFKEHGIDKYAQLVDQNIKQARYLTNLIEKNENLELNAPTSMNIVCFRYNPPTAKKLNLNDINKEIIFELQEKGIAVPSSTTLKGNFVIRVAITNHRSRHQDFDILVEAVIKLGNELI